MMKWVKMLAALLLFAAATPAHAERAPADRATEEAATILKVRRRHGGGAEPQRLHRLYGGLPNRRG